MSGRFAGFPKDAVEFFDKLEANNDRAWFQAHKDVYQRACRGPMEALLHELEPEFGPGKIFRINRDVRFSADKSPYKTNIGAVFGSRNYIGLSTEAFYVGSGAYMLDKDGLERYRDAVTEDASGRDLEKIVGALEKRSYELGSHDTLKSAPKGYPRDHARVRFLRLKGIFAGKGFPPDVGWLSTRKALDKVKTVLSDTKPLNAWLDRHVGR